MSYQDIGLVAADRAVKNLLPPDNRVDPLSAMIDS
jgi:hypothetical protein